MKWTPENKEKHSHLMKVIWEKRKLHKEDEQNWVNSEYYKQWIEPYLTTK